jgi:hypothetical protein
MDASSAATVTGTGLLIVILVMLALGALSGLIVGAIARSCCPARIQ